MTMRIIATVAIVAALLPAVPAPGAERRYLTLPAACSGATGLNLGAAADMGTASQRHQIDQATPTS